MNFATSWQTSVLPVLTIRQPGARRRVFRLRPLRSFLEYCKLYEMSTLLCLIPNCNMHIFFQQEGRIDILIFIKNVYAIRQGDHKKKLKCRRLGLLTVVFKSIPWPLLKY